MEAFLDKAFRKRTVTAMKHEKQFWKFYCEEDKYPGMWQRWLKNQCVAVGWPSKRGWFLNDSPRASKLNRGWSQARKRLLQINPGDYVLVSLRGNRVGRLGEVTELRISDTEEDWQPLVPISSSTPDGDKGRRILVRWDSTTGPDDRDLVIKLPESARLNPGQRRGTIAEIDMRELSKLRRAMNDRRNWVSLFEFPYEKALSDYIAAFPHRLEDGLLPHPNRKVREGQFAKRTRYDVLLTDQNDRPVIVECKQSAPTVADVKQLRGYLNEFRKKEGGLARGILVHGGARKLREDVRRAAQKKPKIELVQFTVGVDFSVSG